MQGGWSCSGFAFRVASFLIAFASTAIAARILDVQSRLRYAFIVASVAAATFLLVALVVDPLPGWHVGGGDRAMLKVAALGNLIAGWCGGMVAFALLVAAPASVHRTQLTRLAGG